MPPLHSHPSTTPGAPPETAAARRAGPRVRRTGPAAWVALAAVAALTLGGCGDGSSSSPSAGPTSGGAGTGNPPMATVVSIDQVAGAVRASYHRKFHARAEHLRRQVGRAVDAWFDGGFAAVDYPTSSYPDAFGTFTAQARHDAAREKDLLTTGPLGARVDGVTVVRRKVALDVLAPKGRPAGVTAHVVLRLRTTGQVEKKVTVTGRLFLTQDGSGAWRIFGFDVAKGVR